MQGSKVAWAKEKQAVVILLSTDKSRLGKISEINQVKTKVPGGDQYGEPKIHTAANQDRNLGFRIGIHSRSHLSQYSLIAFLEPEHGVLQRWSTDGWDNVKMSVALLCHMPTKAMEITA